MSRRPTEAETEILAVLWRQGPCTVRQVHEALEPVRGVGYTTVLKLLQIMMDKGLVERDDSKRTHVYEASVPPEEMQGRFVDDLVERIFGGSVEALVMRALQRKAPPPEELERIRRLLDGLDEGEGG